MMQLSSVRGGSRGGRGGAGVKGMAFERREKSRSRDRGSTRDKQ